MAQFRYKALHPSGRMQRGVLDAQNIYDLSQLLQKSKITLIWAKARKKRFFELRWNPTPKSRDLIEFSFQLSRLLESGVPLLESLHEIGTHLGSSPLHDTLVEVIRDVESGKSFLQALQKHARIFDEVFLGLVSAGEKTGKLGSMLKEILNHLQWKETIRKDAQRAVRYPFILAVVMLTAIVTLLVVLVPQMVGFLSSLGVELSASTSMLVATAHFLGNYGMDAALSVGILILSTVTAYQRSENFRQKIEDLFLKIPFYGPLLRKMAMEKFAHVMAIMFRSGIDILECLSVASTIIRLKPLRKEIEDMARDLAAGSALSSAIAEFSRFSPLTVRMVKIGEQSSSLAEALTHVHAYYAQEIKTEIERFIALLEPVLLVIVGAIITWIVMAMFWPLYEASSHLEVF